MEMIKGIQGHGNHDELVVPIIESTALEGELREFLTDMIRVFLKTRAVVVCNHGVFIWGDSWISAKTQAECYHYLFDAAIMLHQLGLNWSSPNHGPNCSFNGDWGCGNIRRALDYMIEPSNIDFLRQLICCILLKIEGTMTPISFVTDILFAYVCDSIGEHIASTYDTEETQRDIILLRSQIQDDLVQGVASTLPMPPDYVGKDLVIACLVANVEAMIRADREVIALKRLQVSHVWRTGFQSKELVGVIFEDVPDALERWHASGIKVYAYSSCSREVQLLLFSYSNFGNLRKYFCGFFDTTMGNKNEAQNYFEILQTMGIERPSDMLYVTNTLQEAVAARSAGLEVGVAIRPKNGLLPENHGFKTIESLLNA
ncbi:hypothetical protein SLE2022_049840 [Rubroshorea leprosula]